MLTMFCNKGSSPLQRHCCQFYQREWTLHIHTLIFSQARVEKTIHSTLLIFNLYQYYIEMLNQSLPDQSLTASPLESPVSSTLSLKSPLEFGVPLHEVRVIKVSVIWFRLDNWLIVSSIYHCSICCQLVIIKYQHKHTSQHKKVTHARILTIVLPMD